MKSGIMIIDKPQAMTSSRVVQQIKHQFGFQKVGHAGTLDPLATGVLIILVNQATKLSDLLLNETKRYAVTMQLYTATTTGDVEGETTSTTPNLNLTQDEVAMVIKKYQDYIYEQVPPIYSAIKKDGKKLYEYARSGEAVELSPREVEIMETKLISYDQKQGLVTFETLVSKGTYIRSLVMDLARDLNTVGHVTALKRLASGNFTIDQATALTILSETDLIPTKTVVDQLKVKQYELSVEEFNKVQHGQKINLDIEAEEVFLVYENEIIALYQRVVGDLFQSVKNHLN